MTHQHDTHNDTRQAPEPANWDTLFPGDASPEAYRARFREQAPVAWEVVEAGQSDLLRMLVGKIPAGTGVGVILGLSILADNHPKGEQVSQAFLGTLMADFEPRRLRTVLVTLAAVWKTASNRPLDERATLIREEMRRVLRRLSTAPVSNTERDAIGFLQGVLDDGV